MKKQEKIIILLVTLLFPEYVAFADMPSFSPLDNMLDISLPIIILVISIIGFISVLIIRKIKNNGDQNNK